MSELSKNGERASGLSSAFAPISIGELIDKITILEIKSERIQEEAKLHNVRSELGALNAILSSLAVPSGVDALKIELRTVNEMLWDIEDRIRGCESRQDFGNEFIDLARNVYITNDRRALIKRQINETTQSAFVEEKSYQNYS